MQKAIELALENVRTLNGGPFAAVIVLNDKIVASGVNTVTTTCDCTAHAEVNAIRNACKVLNSYFLTDCEIYTTCEPCPMCLGAIYWARIKKIWYASTRKEAAEIEFNDDFIYQEINILPELRSIPAHQIMQTEAKEIFSQWQNNEQRKQY